MKDEVEMTAATPEFSPATAPIYLHRREIRPLEFTPAQLSAIRSMPGATSECTDEEFTWFIEQCKARNLNPLLKQIWLQRRWVKGRWDKKTRQNIGGYYRCTAETTIDGLRVIAERTGLYEGQDPPEYVFKPDGTILLARVRVYRKDWRLGRSATGEAYFDEYAGKKYDENEDSGEKTTNLSSMWRDKPHMMIAKCAEAQAFRKAFPEDTGDLYVSEEMERGEADDEHRAEYGAPDNADDQPPAEPEAPKAAPPPHPKAPAAEKPKAAPPREESPDKVKEKIKKYLGRIGRCQTKDEFFELRKLINSEPQAVQEGCRQACNDRINWINTYGEDERQPGEDD